MKYSNKNKIGEIMALTKEDLAAIESIINSNLDNKFKEFDNRLTALEAKVNSNTNNNNANNTFNINDIVPAFMAIQLIKKL